jgi:hypothetical protein
VWLVTTLYRVSFQYAHYHLPHFGLSCLYCSSNFNNHFFIRLNNNMNKVGTLDVEMGDMVESKMIVDAVETKNAVKLVVRWTIQDVLDWLNSVGFGTFSDTFRKHEIDGSVLTKLSDAALKDMGMEIVGKRASLLKKIYSVQEIARAEWRNEVLWSDREYRPSCCNGMLPYGFPFSCVCCVGNPTTYTLTNWDIKLHQTVAADESCCCCGPAVLRINNIELLEVANVNACVVVGSNGDLPGKLFIHTRRGLYYTLIVKSSECEKTAALVNNAKVEAAAVAAAAQNSTLTMLR